MSAAVAIADHLRDWIKGINGRGGLDGYLWIKGTNGRAVSMAIFQSDGAQGVDSSTSYAIVPRSRYGKTGRML